MKQYKLILAIWGLIPLLSSAQSNSITGEFIEKPPQKIIYLTENIGGNYQKIDSCIILDNGEFNFKQHFQTGYYGLSLNDTNWVQIIMNKGDLKLKFHDQSLKKSIEIISSNENLLLWEFMTKRKTLKSQIAQAYMNQTAFSKGSREYISYGHIQNALQEEYHQLVMKYVNKDQNSFLAKTIITDIQLDEKTEFFKYLDFSDEDLIRSGVITKKITDYLQFHTEYTEDGFIESVDKVLELSAENQKVFEFSLNYLLELFNATGPDIILNYIIENYVIGDACTDMEYSDILNKKLKAYKSIQIGKIAPNISIFNNDGIMQNLYDICSFSKLNILYFGSSHCQFCEESTPELIKLTTGHEKNEIQLIYISLDTEVDEWKESISKLPTSWIKFSELKSWESKSTEIFQVHKTPSFYILDQKSTIISKPKNVDELKSEIEYIKKGSN
jgi:hypothetical protein